MRNEKVSIRKRGGGRRWREGVADVDVDDELASCVSYILQYRRQVVFVDLDQDTACRRRRRWGRLAC